MGGEGGRRGGGCEWEGGGCRDRRESGKVGGVSEGGKRERGRDELGRNGEGKGNLGGGRGGKWGEMYC